MRRDLILACLCLILMTAPILADEPAETPVADAANSTVEAPAPPRSLLNLSAADVAQLKPLQRELRQILLTERDKLAELHAAFEQETDALRSLDIQKQIRDVKQSTERALVQAQIDHARAAGRQAAAERLEAALERMYQPETENGSSTPTPPRPSATPRTQG